MTSNLSAYDKGMIYFESRSTATIAIETSVMVFLALFAIAGNLLVVISFVRNRAIRTITNYFVLSLSVLDLVIPVTVVPPTLIWSIKSRFSVGYEELCDFQAVWSAGLILVSIINITFMAINRFACVCKPQKYKKLFNHKTSLGAIVGFWVVGFGIMISSGYIGDGVYARFSPFKISCLYVYSNSNKISFFVKYLPHMLFLGVPSSIMVFCYYSVFKTIGRHKRNIAPSIAANGTMGVQGRSGLGTNGRNTMGTNGHSGLSTSVQEIKITRTLFAVLFAYFCTWIPFFSVMLAANLLKSIPREIQMIVTYTGVGGSVINPVIYGVYNKAFRQEYKKTFGYFKACLNLNL